MNFRALYVFCQVCMARYESYELATTMITTSPSAIRYITNGLTPMREIARMNRTSAMLDTKNEITAASMNCCSACACNRLLSAFSEEFISIIPSMLAPVSAGRAVSIASLAACLRESPYIRAIVITTPARDAPGISAAKHWHRPTPSIASRFRFSIFFLRLLLLVFCLTSAASKRVAHTMDVMAIVIGFRGSSSSVFVCAIAAPSSTRGIVAITIRISSLAFFVLFFLHARSFAPTSRLRHSLWKNISKASRLPLCNAVSSSTLWLPPTNMNE